ncbi:MAG: DUF2384 domain-containing protein [Actinobacteria bacterium]|nr:DUF2384 domain-containing protein [Actinomycetota bacterium]
MTYENNLAGRIEGDRIDQVAEWLEATLGPRLTAFSVHIPPLRLGRIAHGDEQPGAEVERRLRNLYAVVRLLTQRDSLGPAQDWLMQPNPELHHRAPAELLREGESPEPVWFAAAPTF